MPTTAQSPPGTKKYDERTIVNFPNQVTTVRLGLSIVLFVLLNFHWYWAGFWLFVIAAGTDWLDGFWARRYGQITILGRMLDPFVDKVIICGTYIFLAADANSGLQAWMAVLVLGRELLVTAPRFSRAARGRLFGVDFRQAEIHFAMYRRWGEFGLVELQSQSRAADQFFTRPKPLPCRGQNGLNGLSWSPFGR